ncbi:hypothetical protein [Phenylobacterium kunshanense]|uniref:Uncharacterized protein n=1 Tax=Phenylobacterium kunshanense TaxID=1445034 RepID=A0A328BJB2_9CAUL|nr:hypothetical protein [Phenylobacterium kunshanense]RAK67400.1 hypothetical protein DJ019_05610 [Phenylobacterium kunshanense]
MADDADIPIEPAREALDLVSEAEARLDELGPGFDAPGLTGLRTLISGYPDMGAPGAGEVVASLFTLLGRFLAGGRCDTEAILVHLKSWRLLLAAPPSPEGEARLMAGLKAIRDLYQEAEAA